MSNRKTKTATRPQRTRMVNEYGVPAHPLTDHVHLWEKQGWKVQPDSSHETDPEPADTGDNLQ